MTSRDWFCLALRLFGIWLLIQSIQEFVPSLFYLLSEFGSGGQSFSYWVYTALWFLLRTSLALLLLLFAPAISTRFYGAATQAEPAANEPSQSEQRALRVGIQLLAVYAILLGVQSLSGVIMGFLSSDTISFGLGVEYGSAGHGYLTSLLTCGMNFFFAFLLIVWKERIIALVEQIRYVADRDAYEPPPIDEEHGVNEPS